MKVFKNSKCSSILNYFIIILKVSNRTFLKISFNTINPTATQSLFFDSQINYAPYFFL